MPGQPVYVPLIFCNRSHASVHSLIKRQTIFNNRLQNLGAKCTHARRRERMPTCLENYSWRRFKTDGPENVR
eukprot:7546001-Pyramimonas_sp.AAC.1